MLLIICFQITNSQWRSKGYVAVWERGVGGCDRMRVRVAYACNQFCHRNTYLYTHERTRAIYAPRTKYARPVNIMLIITITHLIAHHTHTHAYTHTRGVNPCYMFVDEWIARRIVLLDSLYHINSTSTFLQKVFAVEVCLVLLLLRQCWAFSSECFFVQFFYLFVCSFVIFSFIQCRHSNNFYSVAAAVTTVATAAATGVVVFALQIRWYECVGEYVHQIGSKENVRKRKM